MSTGTARRCASRSTEGQSSVSTRTRRRGAVASKNRRTEKGTSSGNVRHAPGRLRERRPTPAGVVEVRRSGRAGPPAAGSRSEESPNREGDVERKRPPRAGTPAREEAHAGGRRGGEEERQVRTPDGELFGKREGDLDFTERHALDPDPTRGPRSLCRREETRNDERKEGRLGGQRRHQIES